MKQELPIIAIAALLALAALFYYLLPQAAAPQAPITPAPPTYSPAPIPNATNATNATTHPNVTITLERGVCFGYCPSYSLTIYGNGTVVYTGSEFVDTKGTRVSGISAEKVNLLVSEFERIGYFSLNDSYETPMATDLPTSATSITLGGKTKRIIHYHGDFSAPEGLTALENRIDEVANSSQWVGRLPNYGG